MRLNLFVWDENIGAELSCSPCVQLDTVADASSSNTGEGGTGSSDTWEDIGDQSSLKFETVFSWSDISHVAVF
jgi:hypothetical protein